MPNKTGIEIAGEIKALEEIKPKLPKTNFFGENIHDKVDAQIEVLKGDVTGEEFEDLVDSGEWTESQRDEAQNALDWMEGQTDDSSPSEQWVELVK